MSAQDTYENVVEALLDSDPRVSRTKMFGMPTLKINGKAFAGFFNDALIVKLGVERVQQLLKTKGAHEADPSGMGRPMKEWVVVDAPKSGAHKKWLALAEEAKSFVAGG
ncbi:MAG: hypothetical protein ACRELV_03035 [Longimicrobiales bacterium]